MRSARPYFFVLLLPLLTTLPAGPAWAQAAAVDPEAKVAWQRLTGILQYLETDYPLAIETRSELELEEQRLFIADALSIAGELGEAAAPLVPRLELLQRRIQEEAEPESVSPVCAELIAEIIEIADLESSPPMTPDLEAGKALFAQQCALCHGPEGRGDGPGAHAEMDPPPTDFHDEGMDGLTPFKAFNTIRFGIGGTEMPGFPHLDDEQRWALAFFLVSLRHPPCEGEALESSLQELATSSDRELAARYGEDALACLRRKLPEVDSDDLLAQARAGVLRAVELAAKGDALGARRELLDAYLGGIEPIEPRLRARDPGLVLRIENQFLKVRAAVEGSGDDVAQEGERLLAMLETVPATGGTTGFAVFWVAFFILLREGFEAIIVIGALLAVLKRLKQPHHAKVVHAGWVSALAVGALGFLFARQLLLGANREWLEGIAALVAVVMLLYHTLWLSARAHVAEYMQELRGKVEGAVGAGSVTGLFGIAFVAALRESFETVLFLQGLSIDSPGGVLWGATAGLVALLLLVLVVSRVGFKLPMRFLFKASTVLLFGTAVVLLGKGLRAFQEVGALPLKPVPFVMVDLLGVYPDAVTLVPQLLLLLAVPVWKLRARLRGTGAVSNLKEG